MAVPKFESLLTAFERNDEQVNMSGYGRFTNVATHNKTYEGVLIRLDEFDQKARYGHERYFTRGNANQGLLYIRD